MNITVVNDMTLFYIIFSILFKISVCFNLIDPFTIYFSPHFIIKNFEIQRILFSPFYSESPFLITAVSLYLLYKILSKIEDTHFYSSPGSFLYLLLYAHVGVIISGFIEPEPGLSSRTFLFFVFLFCKLFSNLSLGINKIASYFIPLTVYPFAYIILQFLFVAEDRNVAKLFLMFWSHGYFFLHFMANTITHKTFFQAPQWLDRIFFRIII